MFGLKYLLGQHNDIKISIASIYQLQYFLSGTSAKQNNLDLYQCRQKRNSGKLKLINIKMTNNVVALATPVYSTLFIW